MANNTPVLLNSTILSLKESATLAINQRAKTLRNKGSNIVHFGFGQSPFDVPSVIQDALKKNVHQNTYLPTLGLLELREAFCQFYETHYGYRFKPANVLVGPGSKELIFQTLFILEGPLLIPAPSWVSYGPQAHIRGKEIYPIMTKRENGYKLTPEELTKTCKKLEVYRQKILIINNPNNPTGAVYHDKEIEAISKVCREHGVVVIADEIYSLIDFSSREFKGFSKHYSKKTIVTNGLSKGFSAGGYRLGLLAVPENLSPAIRCLSAMVSETFSAVSAPIQYAAVDAFTTTPELTDYIQTCTAIHKAATHYLYGRFIQMGLGCPKPEGAFYLFPDFVAYSARLRKMQIRTSQELCDFLLEKFNIATLPGSDFYCSEEHLGFRVAAVDYDGPNVFAAAKSAKILDDAFIETNCPNLKAGCDRLEQFVHTLTL